MSRLVEEVNELLKKASTGELITIAKNITSLQVQLTRGGYQPLATGRDPSTAHPPKGR